MRTDTRTFIAANQAKSKDTRFTIVQSFDTANTILRAFTSHVDSAGPSGVTAYKGVIKSFTSTSQSLDPITGNSTIGDISYEVVDYTSQITTELGTQLNTNDRSVRKKRTQVYVGYRGMAWADYTLLTTQFVDRSVEFDSGIYKFNCSDIQREMRVKIMKPKETTISAAFSKTATTLNVVATSAFEMVAHDSGYSDAPSATVGYVKVSKNKDEFEILRYTGKTATSFTGLTRARFGTREIELTYDATVSADRQPKVEEIIYLEGPVPKIIYAVRTGVLYNQGGAVLPSHWHQGISTTYVRLADFTGFGEDFWDTADPAKGFQYYQVGLKETDGKSFVEKQLQLMIGAFGPIYADGSVGLKRMAAVLSSSGYAAHLNSSNVVSYSGLTHDYQKVHNVIEVLWNYDYVAQKHTRVNLFVDTDSQIPYGSAEKYTLKFDGLSGDIHTTAMLTNQFAAIRDRYAGPPLLITVNVLPSLNALEVGDTVRLTLDGVRDYTKPTGTIGSIDRVFEIQNITINWLTGDLQLKLFGSSRLAKWVPLSTTTGTALSDAYYTSAGTVLSTPLTIAANAVTANGTVTGASRFDGARFYHNGDLTINSGVTVTCTQNVMLVIKGHLTINGTLTTKGQGLAGASVPSLSRLDASTFYNAGTRGDIGSTHGQGALFPSQNNDGTWISNPTAQYSIYDTTDPSEPKTIWVDYAGPEGSSTYGIWPKLPTPNPVWNGTTLTGLPWSLRGTSGGSGAPVISWRNAIPGETQVAGGAGGAGGGGLLIICRGLSFGGSGKIDVSGADGVVGGTLSEQNAVFIGGGGAGGAAGACCIIADGNLSNFTYPTAGQFVAQQGQTAIGGAFAPETPFTGGPYTSAYVGATNISSLGTLTGYRAGVDGSGFGGANYMMIRMEPSQVAAADVPLIAAPPTAVAAVESANTPQTPAENLATVTVTTTPPSDTNRVYDQVYYRVTGTTPWTPLGPANNVRTFIAAMDGTSYEIEARSISQAGKESPTGARTTIVMSNAKGGATLGTGNYIAIDKTSYADTTAGIFMEKSSGGVARTNFGDAANYVKWTGTALEVKGAITADSGTFTGTVQATSGGFGTGYTPVTITTAGLTLTGAAGITMTGSGSIKVSSGSSYIEYTATSIKGYSNSLGLTTFELKADGSAPTFSGGVVNTTIFNVSSSGIIRTSATAGDGSASGYGVIMNDTGLKGYKASSSTPTFVLNASNGDASFGQTTTTKYIKFTASTGDVELGRDSKLLGTSGYNNDNPYWEWFGDSRDGLGASTSGAATTAMSAGKLFMTVTTANGDIAQHSKVISDPRLAWTKSRRLKFYFTINATPGANQQINVGLGHIVTTPGCKLCFRIKQSSLAIYGVSGDNSTETETSLSTTLVANTTYLMEIDFLSGTNAKFYIDGSLKATITTTLPACTSGDSMRYMFASDIRNSGASSATEISVFVMKFLQDP